MRNGGLNGHNVINLAALGGAGPRGTLFMYEGEREMVEYLGNFALSCFQRSRIQITDMRALVTSLSRAALAWVSEQDPEVLKNYTLDVVWLPDGEALPEGKRFVERRIQLAGGG